LEEIVRFLNEIVRFLKHFTYWIW